MNNPCGPVPLLFITGFLGSGKTTLLNRILDEAAAQGKKIGVIINEWGRVNIDSSLIRAKDIEIEELNDGGEPSQRWQSVCKWQTASTPHCSVSAHSDICRR